MTQIKEATNALYTPTTNTEVTFPTTAIGGGSEGGENVGDGGIMFLSGTGRRNQLEGVRLVTHEDDFGDQRFEDGSLVEIHFPHN